MLLAGAFDKLNSIMGSFAPDNTMFSGPESFVFLLANLFVYIAGGLSVIAIAFGFLQLATSSGDVKNAEKAQRAILWGAVGLVVSFLAFILKNVLLKTAGVSGVL